MRCGSSTVELRPSGSGMPFSVMQRAGSPDSRRCSRISRSYSPSGQICCHEAADVGCSCTWLPVSSTTGHAVVLHGEEVVRRADHLEVAGLLRAPRTRPGRRAAGRGDGAERVVGIARRAAPGRGRAGSRCASSAARRLRSRRGRAGVDGQEVERDADAAGRPALAEPLHRHAVREQLVVHRRRRRVGVAEAGRVRAVPVPDERVRLRLVEREPVGVGVAERLEARAPRTRRSARAVSRFCPAAGVLQRLRQVPVEQGDRGCGCRSRRSSSTRRR